MLNLLENLFKLDDLTKYIIRGYNLNSIRHYVVILRKPQDLLDKDLRI